MKLCQLEFYSRDVKASLSFLEAFLGWKEVPVAIQGQAILAVGDESPYGVSIRSYEGENKKAVESTELPTALIAYFEVQEPLTELRDHCLKLGGSIIKEPSLMTAYGTVMQIRDPGGLEIGLFKADFKGPPERTKPKA